MRTRDRRGLRPAGTTRSGLRLTLLCSAAATLGCASFALFAPMASAQTGPPLAWKAPVLVEHAPFAHGNLMENVSCPSVSLCVAGDHVGNIFATTDPGAAPATWTAAADIAPGKRIEFLTCQSATFCLAEVPAGGGRFQIFTSTNPAGGPSAWVAATTHVPTDKISCPSSKLCVIGAHGQILVSTNPTAGAKSVWKVTASWPALSSTPITGMSCPSASLCVAADIAGDVYTSADPTGGKSAWKITEIDPAGLAGMTCPSASFCATLDEQRMLEYSTNPAGGLSAWHLVSFPVAPYFAIWKFRCLSATFCTDLDSGDASDILTTTNPIGGPWQVSNVDGSFTVDAFSCASTTLCAAVDYRGDALTSTNPTGGPSAWNPVNVSGVSGIVSLDCPNATLCVAGDDNGNIITSNRPGGGAAAWHSAHIDGPLSNGVLADIDGISCPSAGLCVAVDSCSTPTRASCRAPTSQGNVLWATNPTGGAPAWSAANIDGMTNIDSVACPTMSLCVAADAAGNILSSTDPTGGASAWHSASLGLSGEDNAIYVTCPTTALCLASGYKTIYISTNPTGGAGAWQPSATFAHAIGIGPITCRTKSFCIAIGHVSSDHPLAGPVPTIFSSENPTGGIADWNLVSPTPGHGSQVDPGGTVSCPTKSFCLAEFGPGSEVFDSLNPDSNSGGTWANAGTSAAVVSCGSPSFCVAGDGFGHIQVGIARTTTALKLSAGRVAYGHEHRERLTVAVRSQVHRTPTGTVVISVKTTTICTLRRLVKGTASCTLTRKQLKPGTYRLAARYVGSSIFVRSKSAVEVLTVVKPR